MHSSLAEQPLRFTPICSPAIAMWICCGLFGTAILLGNPNFQWTTVRDAPFGADFLQEWVAGDMLLHGAAEHVYDRAAFSSWQHDEQRIGFEWPVTEYYPAVYPPVYYCLVAPLAFVPYRVATYIWLAFMLAAYATSAQLAQRLFVKRHETANSQYLFWCVCLLMPAMFFGSVIGQKGPLWLLIITGCITLIRYERPMLAGCVASLLILKPTLCFLLPIVWLLNRQWQMCIGFVCGALALVVGSLLLVPISMWWDYVSVVSSVAGYQSHGGYRTGWSTSLLTLLRWTGCPQPMVIALFSAIAIALIASCVRWRGQLSVEPTVLQPQWWLRVLSITALLSPHAYFYDLVWLLMPLSGMLLRQWRPAVLLLGILWLSMLLAQSFEHGLPVVAMVVAAVSCGGALKKPGLTPCGR